MNNRSATPTPVTLESDESTPSATAVVYRCRLSLGDLRETDNPEVKFCDHCSRSVFRVRDVHGLLQLVATDSCGWIDNDRDEVVMGLFREESES